VEDTYPPHYEKDLVYKYYETKRVIGKLYSQANAGGVWSWNTEAQSAALSARSGSHPYASIMINGTTKSISDNATYNKGFEYTDWKETATSWENYSVVFKIHCWY